MLEVVEGVQGVALGAPATAVAASAAAGPVEAPVVMNPSQPGALIRVPLRTTIASSSSIASRPTPASGQRPGPGRTGRGE